MQTTRYKYLIAYDISDNKRLYQAHKKGRNLSLLGGQKSFYECWLTEHEMERFKQEVNELIEPLEDRVFIFRIPDNVEPQLFGKATLQSISLFLLI